MLPYTALNQQLSRPRHPNSLYAYPTPERLTTHHLPHQQPSVKLPSPLPPVIVLLRTTSSHTTPSTALLHSTRTNTTRLLSLHGATTRLRLPRASKFVPEVFFIFRRALRRRAKALPKVFALGFALARRTGSRGGMRRRVAFDEAGKLRVGGCDARL